jgi:transcriptional regulator with XRE-family HTH domain
MNDSIPPNTQIVRADESPLSSTKKVTGFVSDNEGSLRNTESSDLTVRQALSRYDIGPKLRQLRLKKKIALVDLGKHTGLSPSMLSQLENGKLVPTLPTLAKIAMVFDIGLEHFFADRRQKRTFAVIRSDERMKFPERPDSPVPGYFFEVLAFGPLEKALSAYLAEFPVRERKEVQLHNHSGAEFIHLLEGVLAINYQSEDHILKAGDSAYFDGSEPHAYYGQSDPPARAIIITTPRDI